MIGLFYELLARLGFWIPCSKHLPDKKKWDWVLISYVNHGFRGVPSIGEYSYKLEQWHTDNENEDYYIAHDCIVTHWHKLPKNKRTWK